MIAIIRSRWSEAERHEVQPDGSVRVYMLGQNLPINMDRVDFVVLIPAGEMSAGVHSSQEWRIFFGGVCRSWEYASEDDARTEYEAIMRKFEVPLYAGEE